MDAEYAELLEAHKAAYCAPRAHHHDDELSVIRCALAILAEGDAE